jgi:predicted Zn-dependent protease
MNFNPRPTPSLLLLALTAFCTGTVLGAHPSPQSKPSRSDEDLTAIGHRIVGQGVNLYSLERENKLGEQLAKEVNRSSRMLDDPTVTDYVNRIAQKIAQNSDARGPITVRVIDSDVINAFTLPGGFLYLNTGLFLQTEGEAELAGVLARGVAHTALRSFTKETTKGELMQLAAVPFILLGPGGWAGYGNFEGANLSIPLTSLKCRRDAERAADFFGLQYLYKAGYDPESYIRFLGRGWPQTPGGKDSLPKAFRPFPPVPERVENMKKEIAKILPPRDGAIVSSPEFQEVKEHLRLRKLNEGSAPNGNLGKPTLRQRTKFSPHASPPPMPDCE